MLKTTSILTWVCLVSIAQLNAQQFYTNINLEYSPFIDKIKDSNGSSVWVTQRNYMRDVRPYKISYAPPNSVTSYEYRNALGLCYFLRNGGTNP